MVRFFTIAVVIAVAAAAAANMDKDDKKDMKMCPFGLAKTPFDGEQFDGDWYVIAQNTWHGEDPPRCGKVIYKSDNDTITMTYKGLAADNTHFTVKSISSAYWGGALEASNSMGVFKIPGSDRWSDVYDQMVVATDYSSYALVTACRFVFKEKTHTFGRHLVGTILGRKPTLSRETYDTLKSVLSGQDIEPDKIVKVDQKNC